ncbi:MAG: alpha/beta family hydrolase [Lysinibacillus sp.]
MKGEKKSLVTKTNKQLTYTHIKQGSDRVCFMFCGSGYTYDKPLLYYATMLMLEQGLDVVHAHYAFDEQERSLPLSEFANLIGEEVELVVEKVAEEGEYREMMFLGKSLGTIPIISNYIKDDRHSNTKFILLTPLLEQDILFNRLTESDNHILIVIGTDDPYYIHHKITALNEKRNITLKEIQQANHSLDIGPNNTSASIQAIGDIMEAIREFVG